MRIPGLTPNLHLGSSLALAALIWPSLAAAQSSAEYTRWMAWCRSIGGTPNGNPNRPECIPGAPVNGNEEPYVPPPVDPAVEKLRADTEAFRQRLAAIMVVSPTLTPLFDSSPPANEAELSRRADRMLAVIWPEFASTAVEAELLRRQTNFYRENIRRRQGTIEELSRLRSEQPALERQAGEAEARVEPARERQREMNFHALRWLNDHSSERFAAATLAIFGPLAGDPETTLSRGSAEYETVPGAPAQTVYFPVAGPSPPWAEPRVPIDQARFALTLPDTAAPIEQKLAMLGRIGTEMQRDVRDLRDLRSFVPNQAATYAAIPNMTGDLYSMQLSAYILTDRIAQANAAVEAADANTRNSATVLVGEIVRDMAIEAGTARLREIADDIAGTAGLQAAIPTGSREDWIEFARRGGRVLLPENGFAQQWEAFVEVQNQTLSVLDRAEGFMTEATRLAATGSPSEMEELLDRVFASVRWQSFEYARTVGLSALPEGQDTTLVEEVFNRYLDKLRERQTGEGN